MFLSEYDPKTGREVVREFGSLRVPTERSGSKKTAQDQASAALIPKPGKQLFGAEEVLILAVMYFALFHTEKPDYHLLCALVVLFFGDRGLFAP